MNKFYNKAVTDKTSVDQKSNMDKYINKAQEPSGNYSTNIDEDTKEIPFLKGMNNYSRDIHYLLQRYSYSLREDKPFGVSMHDRARINKIIKKLSEYGLKEDDVKSFVTRVPMWKNELEAASEMTQDDFIELEKIFTKAKRFKEVENAEQSHFDKIFGKQY